jgi:hypothetical protein
MDSNNDAAALDWFALNFLAARNGTIDGMRDFENALVRVLLTHGSPSFRLIEVCAKELQWPTRWQELFDLVGVAASNRLKGLLDLTVEHRFSSQFAANPWQRHLFSPASTTLPRIGRTPLLDHARKVAESWKQRCAELNVPGHVQALNPMAMRHVENHCLQRCDIYNGLLLSLYAFMYTWKTSVFEQSGWATTSLCFVIFLVGCGLRLAWRWSLDQAMFQAALPWLRKLGIGVFALGFLVGLAQRELATIEWLVMPSYVFRGLFLTYMAALGLWMQWWTLRVIADMAMTWKLQAMKSADYEWWEVERPVTE